MVEFVCTECYKRLPLDCFRFPRTKCVECLGKEADDKRQIAQLETLRSRTKDMMAQVLDENFLPTPGTPQLMEVISEVYQCFGGPRNFAKKIYDQIEELLARRPVSAASVGVMLQFMRLQMKLEENLKKEELAEMSDDQLKREQDIGLMKLMLDAAADPRRRVVLDRLMAMQGMKLLDVQPEEILQDANDGSNPLKAAAERAGFSPTGSLAGVPSEPPADASPPQ